MALKTMEIEKHNDRSSLVGKDLASLSKYLQSLFERLNEASVSWAILRGAEGLPFYTRRDVDILVAEQDYKRAAAIVYEVATELGWVRLATFKSMHMCAQWLMYPGKEPLFLPIELFLTQAYRGVPLVDAAYGLANRKQMPYGVWVVPDGFSAVTTLLKELVSHGKVQGAERLASISKGAAGDPECFAAALSYTIKNEKLLADLLAACREGDWDQLSGHYQSVRHCIVRWSPRMCVRWLAFCYFAIRLRLAPPLSLFAVVIGPDGSGKTTVSDILAEKMLTRPFATVWRCKTDFAVLPRLRSFTDILCRLIGRPVKHAAEPEPGTRHMGMQPPLHPLRAMVYISYYGIGLFLGRIKLRLWRSIVGLILFDRYYYDYYYMLGHSRVPKWFLDLVEILVPKPDLIFYLDRPAKEIYAQKPELTVDEIERQQLEIKSLLANNKHARLIDAGKGVISTIDAMTADIYDYLVTQSSK